jgi:hypothetical protein
MMNEEETEDYCTKKIENLADLQMRETTHLSFLENYTTGVVPNGLSLELQVLNGSFCDHNLYGVCHLLVHPSSTVVTYDFFSETTGPNLMKFYWELFPA